MTLTSWREVCLHRRPAASTRHISFGSFFGVFCGWTQILQQKCLKKWIGSCRPAMNTTLQLLTVYTDPERHSAQRQRWTDRQTDRRHYDAKSLSHGVQYDRIKKQQRRVSAMMKRHIQHETAGHYNVQSLSAGSTCWRGASPSCRHRRLCAACADAVGYGCPLCRTCIQMFLRLCDWWTDLHLHYSIAYFSV